MGSDLIERVNLYKPARMGGTKMLIAANAYLTVHKQRNIGFWQPTETDAQSFVKTEVQPAIRDCKPWDAMLLDSREGSKSNTLGIKQFLASSSHYRGGATANNFRRIAAKHWAQKHGSIQAKTYFKNL
ncbi:MAG: hypothetical protein Pars92KO_32540 [Parasphingorhabdus sp.]